MNLIRKNAESVIKVDELGIVPLLKFPIIEKTGIVSHGFTTRVGGVSENEFSTLNLSFTRGDIEESVVTNFERVAKSLNRQLNDFVFTDQTHTTNIRKVGIKDKGKGIVTPLDYSDVDGIITNEPQIILSGFFADCVPIFLVDPVRKAIGMVHSGWRGTAGKISKNAINRMYLEYGTNPKDIIAAIGPSICRDCYEVSEDVKEEFDSSYSMWQVEQIFDKKPDRKYQLDLWMANKLVLLEAGVLEENIEVTDICTCCNSEILFSHRASHGKRGNLGAFISLNE